MDSAFALFPVLCVTVVIMVVYQQPIAFAFREPIKPFTLGLENTMAKYHIAQILPPGKYKVIIWDKVIRNNRSPFFTYRSSQAENDSTTVSNNGSSRSARTIFDPIWSRPNRRQYVFAYDPNSFNGYAQYFAHFYNVETDNQGQFLVEKNGRVADWSLFNRHYCVNITPMKGTALIKNDSKRVVPWQKVYSRGIRTPVDSLCNFHGNRCLINYFEKFYDWIFYTRLTFDAYWLAEPCIGVIEDRVNFFLIASFRHAIGEAKRKYEIGRQMDAQEAHILGIYLNTFTRTNKNGILLERIRLIDAHMLRLLNEFCRIDMAYLLSHVDLVYELYLQRNDYEAFCPSWAIVYDKLSRFNQPAFAFDAFYHWIYSGSSLPLGEEIKETVQFWLGMFSKWLNDYAHNTAWLELDLSLFNQIGQLLVGSHAARLITLEKLQQITGVRTLLNNICVGAYRSVTDFLINNGNNCYSIIDQWRIKLCSSGRFVYSTPPRPVAATVVVPHSFNSPRSSPITNHHPNSVSPLPPSPRKPSQLLAQIDAISQSSSTKSGDDNGSNANSKNCVICLTNDRDYAFTPCHHLCGCDGCTEKVLMKAHPQCPICRSPTHGKVRIYQP